jgi:cyclase
MILKRRIPIILVLNERAVITSAFRSPYYVSDPANLVRIYSDKEVDELMVLQINDRVGLPPNFDYLCKLAKLCKSPLIMGGAVRSIQQIEMLINGGAERVLLGRHAILSPQFLTEAAKKFGSSSLTVNIDYTGGLENEVRLGVYNSSESLLQTALKMQDAGAGEIVFTAVDRNGARCGYDNLWVDEISLHLNVPVLINGGCSNKQSMNSVLNQSAIAGACASTALFSYNPNKAVLPVYPSEKNK